MTPKTFNWKARNTVLSILSIAWVLSFMDRMAMSVAIPYIASDFHFSPFESGLVMSTFFASYSLSQVPGGLLADMWGVRWVLSIAMLWWSAFTAITGAVATLAQMLTTRFVFGLGEGVLPGCSFKSIAVWFPRKERARANAVIFATNPLGAAISPLVTVWIMSSWSWRGAFYSLALPGVLISILLWLLVSDRPAESPHVSAKELAEIEGEGDTKKQRAEKKANHLAILRQPIILRYFAILFTFDMTWWGFTTWLPMYLVRARQFSMVQMGVAASLPFFAGTIGCIVGGWLSDKYFSSSRRRLIVIAQCASALLLYFTFVATNRTMLIISQTLAGFSLNVFFTAFWALPMNTVPKRFMGVTGGFINMAGQIAAVISPLFIGYLVGLGNGSFELTFTFMIVALLLSCIIVLSLPGNIGSPGETVGEFGPEQEA